MNLPTDYISPKWNVVLRHTSDCVWNHKPHSRKASPRRMMIDRLNLNKSRPWIISQCIFNWCPFFFRTMRGLFAYCTTNKMPLEFSFIKKPSKRTVRAWKWAGATATAGTDPPRRCTNRCDSTYSSVPVMDGSTALSERRDRCDSAKILNPGLRPPWLRVLRCCLRRIRNEGGDPTD